MASRYNNSYLEAFCKVKTQQQYREKPNNQTAPYEEALGDSVQKKNPF